uniref:VWFC domain-containing protein n=1 Tax=Anopheles melas TaxID=34690 RepID=A0A182TUQ0_9DIPT
MNVKSIGRSIQCASTEFKRAEERWGPGKSPNLPGGAASTPSVICDLERAECQFGKTIRELHTTWFADLGPPFGVMYCIMCECVPFQKKRRVVGRVQCRNIKNECPKPTCDDPILLPGRCCKTCPGDAQTTIHSEFNRSLAAKVAETTNPL